MASDFDMSGIRDNDDDPTLSSVAGKTSKLRPGSDTVIDLGGGASGNGVDHSIGTHSLRAEPSSSQRIHHFVQDKSIRRNYVLIVALGVIILFEIANAIIAFLVLAQVDITPRWWLLSTAVVLAVFFGFVAAGVTLNALRTSASFSTDHKVAVGQCWTVSFLTNGVALLVHAVYNSNYDGIDWNNAAQSTLFTTVATVYIVALWFGCIVIPPAWVSLWNPEIRQSNSLFTVDSDGRIRHGLRNAIIEDTIAKESIRDGRPFMGSRTGDGTRKMRNT